MSGLPSIVVMVAALSVSSSQAAAPQRQLPPENLTAADVLLPLLKDLHQRLQPGFQVRWGNLPPSPFTGQRTAVVAVTIGRRSVKVDEDTRRALDQLLMWNPASAPASPEAILFDEWLQQLKIKTGAVIAVHGADINCDTGCVIQRLTRLDETLGSSRKQREELRDYLLLESLTAAVR